MFAIDIVSWLAILIVSIGYWVQVGKIQIHREVRDISIVYYVLLAIGFAILGITAILERSLIFVVKQVATFIPCIVIVLQIIYHRQDRWRDPNQPSCSKCTATLEVHWRVCPFCGTRPQSKGAVRKIS